MQTPIGEGLGSSDALAPVASLSVDEGAPLTPAFVEDEVPYFSEFVRD